MIYLTEYALTKLAQTIGGARYDWVLAIDVQGQLSLRVGHEKISHAQILRVCAEQGETV